MGKGFGLVAQNIVAGRHQKRGRQMAMAALQQPGVSHCAAWPSGRPSSCQ
jgi:hypothetical protein